MEHNYCDCFIFTAGADDKVVLPNQAVMMYDAVTAKNIPAAIVIFEGWWLWYSFIGIYIALVISMILLMLNDVCVSTSFWLNCSSSLVVCIL